MVLPLGSLGSMLSVPTELCPRPSSSHFQFGLDDSASSVRHTPPPATPTHSRQLPLTHVGATSMAVTRLAVTFWAPEKARTPGSTALVLGPYRCQPWLWAGSPARAMRSNVRRALATAAGG